MKSVKTPSKPDKKIDIKSVKTPSKPAKKMHTLSICFCFKLDLLSYWFHICNYIGLTTFVGLYVLFVADSYGWIDAMLKDRCGFWFDYCVKIAFCLSLIAVAQFWLSLAFVRVMHKRPKFMLGYLSVMYLLNIVAILAVAVIAVVRFDGTWMDFYMAFKERLFLYVVWIFIMMGAGRSFFCIMTTKEKERMMESLYQLLEPSA